MFWQLFTSYVWLGAKISFEKKQVKNVDEIDGRCQFEQHLTSCFLAFLFEIILQRFYLYAVWVCIFFVKTQ